MSRANELQAENKEANKFKAEAKAKKEEAQCSDSEMTTVELVKKANALCGELQTISKRIRSEDLERDDLDDSAANILATFYHAARRKKTKK